ncbi:MAG: bifunctional folylpolyglutamate synthase/dihydrofolate synthase [Verrucomicrobia bacterium]|nr:bifunctional folylpolyglutamate synthase/dihydrofolate synthase [Verrucomicrobiota bacterium]MBI3870950.1 bifunctional folylpolyglutamate synthase/dihydrofolate synthase [Verrucomicrobiota bacterium]
MTYPEVIEKLQALGSFGMRMGLDKMRVVSERLGSPHDHLRFIHVAGTNGKGSVCAFLESIYRQSGLRVGLFTSPHLVHVGERIQVQRVAISEAETISLYEEAHRACDALPPEDPLTFFEFCAAMALIHFKKTACDLVIWETGLGGRLDATNIVTPIASVITNIGLEHQQWLGNTHREIAAEKAGIIKPGVPVFTAVDHPDALAVIRSRALENRAAIVEVGADAAENRRRRWGELRLAGAHQVRNAALAEATARGLRDRIPVSEEAIVTGLRETRWAGRFDVIRGDGETWAIDGAHNLEGARVLAETLSEVFPGQSICLVIGVLKDKDWTAMLAALLPLASRVRAVSVQSERSVTCDELSAHCRGLKTSIAVEDYPNVRRALLDPAPEGVKVITGSLYLVGQVYEEMGWTADARPGERGLNEWRLR